MYIPRMVFCVKFHKVFKDYFYSQSIYVCVDVNQHRKQQEFRNKTFIRQKSSLFTNLLKQLLILLSTPHHPSVFLNSYRFANNKNRHSTETCSGLLVFFICLLLLLLKIVVITKGRQKKEVKLHKNNDNNNKKENVACLF